MMVKRISFAIALLASMMIGCASAEEAAGKPVQSASPVKVSQMAAADPEIRKRKRSASSSVRQRGRSEMYHALGARPKMNWEISPASVPKVGSPEWTKDQEENEKKEQRLRRTIQDICKNC